MAISKDSISEVLSRADIVTEIAGRIALKKAGGNYIGLCPFHGEKSPSFSVSPSKQFYHCFGCGSHGDVIEFLMKHDGLVFHEAVKDLGERVGVKIEEDQDEKSILKAQAQRKAASSLEDLCEGAARFFSKELEHSGAASAYVRGRDISQEFVSMYGIGYAPNGWKPLASVIPDYTTSSALLDAGLVVDDPDSQSGNGKSRIDRFRDRLMFPIRDVRGRCIGFGGRVLNNDNKPKYLNSPETAIFLKHKVLYGLHEARAAIAREKMVFVSEGYMDVVMMAQFGIPNTVGVMGTAMTEDHARLLLRFTDKVCFLFDGDKAGRAAAWKSLRVVLPMLEARHSFSFLTLPDNQDPDEYLRAHGKDQFLKLAKAAPTLSQYLITSLLDMYSTDGRLNSAEAKTQFSVAAEELCALITDTNPLKGMLLQEVDTQVGRRPRDLPRTTPTLSPSDRLRIQSAKQQRTDAAQFQTDASPKRPWVPREEFIKGLAKGEYGSQYSRAGAGGFKPKADLQQGKKTIWQQIGDAVVIAPDKAAEVAEGILALLDDEVEAENALIELLESCDAIPQHPDRYHADEIDRATSLLTQATQVIVKQRKNEIKHELKQMHQSGEISEEEFSSQMLKLTN